MAGGAGRYTALLLDYYSHIILKYGVDSRVLVVSRGDMCQEEVILLMNEYKTISVTSIMTPAPLETASRTDNVDTIIRIMTVKNKSR